ncbi:amino acid ABC transporter permease [Klenkia taihuensis]|uniref:Polar amino acid transport system permease protein n=1 Tax=Klenkia taihuensis TaxID=1225127 RepID=A0A1I1NTK0_9ACTN|nr:amino acid ABC transporter permease [Klenkia taihuensis]GHE11705.1 amino acid ABC transporter permease [Klenkia taihuensis]SFD00746.1 polar amino acid transport system permease protein [Klenkia taihuensis]
MDPAPTTQAPDARDSRPERRPWLWVAWVVLALLAAQVIAFVLRSDRLELPVVGEYLFAAPVLDGLVTTISLTAIATVLGALVCLARLSSLAPLRYLAAAWIAVFRSVPPLVQLLFWFNLAYLVPVLSIGIPFGPSVGEWSANDVITPWTAAVIGLSLYNSPYSAEIIRSGLSAVPRGQLEAASSLGLPARDTFFRIRLPQATRIILPPMGSQVISLLKGTSLVSVIAMTDLLGAAREVYTRTFEVVPLLIVAIVWYIVLVAVLTAGQSWLERRFSRGY